MDHLLSISILICFIFNAISTQYINFQLALINDLNVTCIQQIGLSPSSAADSAQNCIHEAILELPPPTSEAFITVVCTTDTVKKCNEKFRELMLPCLAKENHKIFNQVSEMERQRAISLCANDAENYRAILAEACAKDINLAQELAACQRQVEDGAVSQHLETFFSAENCQKYNEYYKCIKSNYIGCPDGGQAMNTMFDAVFQASPCVNYLHSSQHS